MRLLYHLGWLVIFGALALAQWLVEWARGRKSDPDDWYNM